MSAAMLATLYQHPIKSCSPIEISRAVIDSLGLAGDRRYVLATPEGMFITARKHPKLALLKATLDESGLWLSCEDKAPLHINRASHLDEYREVTVWKSKIQAQRCSMEADRWLSDYLGSDCQLLYFAEQSSRPIRKMADKQVSFADGYPLLLTNTASLEWLQSHCPEPIDMRQMRPNLVIDSSEPFIEDSWQKIRIGEVEFLVFSPCERCKFTTLPPGSSEYPQHAEPLKTMLRVRRAHDGGPLFGQNLIPLNSGVIERGAKVEVLAAEAVDIVRPIES